MSDLKIRFVKFEKALAMQVLEQSEKVYKYLETTNIFSNGLFIKSEHSPEFFYQSIHLRGTHDDENFQVASYLFGDNMERDQYLSKILVALRRLSKNLNEEKPEETKDDFVFEI